MEGPEKHSGKDYFFSADALTPQQVAESLTAATGRKFTAAVLDAETFLEDSNSSATSRTEEWRTLEP
jgi:NAD(P)H dehydrogenase (quinone)